jgi:hypothetical protein
MIFSLALTHPFTGQKISFDKGENRRRKVQGEMFPSVFFGEQKGHG